MENEIILTRELLANNRREQGINGLREPGLTRLCAEEIRLEDRLKRLLKESAAPQASRALAKPE